MIEPYYSYSGRFTATNSNITFRFTAFYGAVEHRIRYDPTTHEVFSDERWDLIHEYVEDTRTAGVACLSSGEIIATGWSDTPFKGNGHIGKEGHLSMLISASYTPSHKCVEITATAILQFYLSFHTGHPPVSAWGWPSPEIRIPIGGAWWCCESCVEETQW